MSRTLLWAFPLVIVFSSAGCYQSAAIRQEAVTLDGDVLAFKAQIQSQQDALNKTFQDSSEKLMDQLTALLNAELDLSRDLNSQAIADQAVIDPNKVLMPGAMHDNALKFISDQFGSIQAVDAQIVAARTQYANSAKTLQAAISQLTNCDSALKKLIATENEPNANEILQDVEGAYDGVKAGIASAKTGSGSSAKAPAVP